MPKVAIVTDSTSCIPHELSQELGIRVVPLTYVFGNTVVADDPSLDMADFYRRLQTSGKPPTTSPASPGAYVETFEELIGNVEAILCITVSPRFSGMHRAATVAKGMAVTDSSPTRVEIMDSGGAAMLQGFVVLAAARAAAEGASLEEVTRVAESVRSRVRLVAVIDTLKYLGRSGRFPRIATWGASIIGLKPILSLKMGQVKPVTVARSRQAAERKILRMLKKDTEGKRRVRVAVLHANVPGEAEAFARIVGETVDCAELLMSHLTPVMGIYTGPGVLGLTYYTE